LNKIISRIAAWSKENGDYAEHNLDPEFVNLGHNPNPDFLNYSQLLLQFL